MGSGLEFGFAVLLMASMSLHWTIEFKSGQHRNASTRALANRIDESRQCAVASCSSFGSRITKVTWKREASISTVLHFLQTHLPSDAYAGCSVSQSEAYGQTGRKDWRSLITPSVLRKLDEREGAWVSQARKLLESTFQSFTRDSLRVLYNEGGDAAYQSLMDDFLVTYAIGRELRSALKESLSVDRHDALLDVFKDMVGSATLVGDSGSIDTAKFRHLLLQRNTVAENRPGGPRHEVSLVSGMVRCQWHNLHQEDDAATTIRMYSDMTAGIDITTEAGQMALMGAARTVFVIWKGRSRTVFQYFDSLDAEKKRLDTIQDQGRETCGCGQII